MPETVADTVVAQFADAVSHGWWGAWVACHALVRNGRGEVLLLQRSGTGYRDGWWHPPAGKLSPGEDVTSCVVRELAEETGLHADPETVAPAHVMHRRNDSPPGPFGTLLDFYFWCDAVSGEPKVMEPDRCSGLMWASPSRLPAQTIPHIVQVFEELQDGALLSRRGWDNT
ncbi:NUDIX domain-containing protein [Actinomadura harenae]|uniref:NUDIX domain-containing protein n=1 Tax=Actinomadura harenae TaxID=2483351 RepID=A0A3M2LXG0_9ACTN|nr:NUDIX domain-containing protein [Actinomadura harenae]RMI41600.1 NUDIX domain-containing protein [Actinomadura harenae]